jgi:hypothetical protein
MNAIISCSRPMTPCAWLSSNAAPVRLLDDRSTGAGSFARGEIDMVVVSSLACLRTEKEKGQIDI